MRWILMRNIHFHQEEFSVRYELLKIPWEYLRNIIRYWKRILPPRCSGTQWDFYIRPIIPCSSCPYSNPSYSLVSIRYVKIPHNRSNAFSSQSSPNTSPPVTFRRTHRPVNMLCVHSGEFLPECTGKSAKYLS